MMLNKVTQEKAAGVPASSDIVLLVSNNVAEGVRAGVLRKMNWASILERPAPSGANVNRISPGGFAVMVASRIAGITYNSSQVKGADIPTSMEDVFNPKWKGKLASTTFATGFYHFAPKDVLGYEVVKNYVQRLAKQIGGLIACNAVDRISSGEFAMLVFDCGQDDALRYQKRGAPVGFTTVKEATRINLMYMGIPVNAEHPNTAALFINFLNTREGQALQWEHARHDLHIYPESETRKLVEKVLAGKGKLALDTVERDEELGHEEISRYRDEFIKILKESGR
jgi:iron(III) transport system substrate-binding protein